MEFRNIKDGLGGIYIHTKDKNRLINGLVYEFINTTDQSGNIDSWPIGNDDYFNHGIYRCGWTYHDLVIGTPLITSPAVLKVTGNESEYIPNNKVICHHIGLEGKYKNLQYKLFATYYLNYGTNTYPFEPVIPQYSFLLQTQIADILPWGIIASMTVGVDHGELYGNNVGFRLSLLKQSGL
jgi:hypothetical protein